MFGLFKKKKDDPVETAPETASVSETAAAPESDPVAATANDPAPAPAPADAGADGGFVPPPGMSGTPSGIGDLPYSPVDPDEEFKATAGAPLADGAEVATEEAVIEALQTVYDPEIPVNIYDLGLIYTCDISDKGDVRIEMTLTAPGCPVAGEMPGMVATAVDGIEGTGEIEVTLVWEPGWHPGMMSEDAKLALGMG